MDANEDTLNAFELDRIELAATQQLLKIALNYIVQVAPDPREARESVASIADTLCANYEIRGFGTAKAAAAREYMQHHAATLISEIGNQI